MTAALELDGIWEVTAEMVLAGLSCHGCDQGFVPATRVATMVDRLSHRGYIIHLGCESNLYAKLGGDDAGTSF